MTRKSCFLLLAFALCAYTTAQDFNGYCYDPEQWDFACECYPDGLECAVCGNAPSIENINCQAYNDTFMKAPLHSKHSSPSDAYHYYTNLSIAQGPGPNNPIRPSSNNHYLRSTTGTGSFVFTTGDSYFGPNVGQITSFDYACASNNETSSVNKTEAHVRAAVPCNITVTLTCPYGAAYYENGPLNWTSYVELTYDPTDYMPMPIANGNVSTKHTKPMYPGMATGTAFPWDSEPQPPNYDDGSSCTSYTWTAMQADGLPAFLYLDNIVYAAYTGLGPYNY